MPSLFLSMVLFIVVSILIVTLSRAWYSCLMGQRLSAGSTMDTETRSYVSGSQNTMENTTSLMNTTRPGEHLIVWHEPSSPEFGTAIRSGDGRTLLARKREQSSISLELALILLGTMFSQE